MFVNPTLHEEMKLNALQRVWLANRRQSASLSVFQENEELDPFTPVQTARKTSVDKRKCSLPSTQKCTEVETVTDDEFLEIQGIIQEKPSLESLKPSLTLNASKLNDIPAKYVIHPVEPHQFPVVGVYVDDRVIPGFKYRIRPLPGLRDNNVNNKKCLFQNRALTLQSIGRGYSRRFTFEADKNCLNSNENYFWSDNRPEGYAFELEAISEGDKFTIFDVVDREAQGTVEIMKVEGNQFEIGSSVARDGIEKRVKVKFIAKVEFYEIGVSKLMPINGVVILLKRKGQNAEITKIINVNIKHHRYYLTPGYQKNFRRVTVRGEDIGDIPTKYTMTGLEPYEIPVVGTYVDPRVLPGFYYRVRPNHRKQHLFQGESLKLLSIGMGYAKRLTFESKSKLNQNNFLWSDNHPDGLGLEPRAVHKGMKFAILTGDQVLGEASVFRADMPHIEEHMEKELTPSGKYAFIKRILIDVICHIRLELNHIGVADSESLMRVCGLAIVRKDPGSDIAKVLRVENIGLDSQLNILFARTQTELVFVPLD